MPVSRKQFGRSDSGFTIMEALIALAIFSVGIMAMGSLQSASLMKTGEITRKTEAWTLLNEQVETLKSIPFYASHNKTDDDGDTEVDEIDELFTDPNGDVPLMGSSEIPYTQTSIDGRYDVHWWVMDDQPIDKINNVWALAPAKLTVSKTITVAVTRRGGKMDTDALAMVQFVRTWAEDGIE